MGFKLSLSLQGKSGLWARFQVLTVATMKITALYITRLV
jgi:hypothetical protein